MSRSPSAVPTGPGARLAAAAVIGVLFMGSTLLTPLYGLYGRAFGASGLVLVLLYAAYVIGNAAALLVFGRLSDRVGRRPVALAAIALAGLSAAGFALAEGLPMLFAARILSGLAVGAGAGAATAWLAELTPQARRAGASTAATTANFIGLAIGPLLGGGLAQYGPWPLQTPFLVYLLLLAMVGAVVIPAAETVRAGAMDRSLLAPRLGVPPGLRLAFVAPAVGMFAAMATVGFFAALGPTFVREHLHVANLAAASAIVAELFVVAAAAIVATRRLTPRTALLAGLALLPVGVAGLEAAQRFASLPWLLASTAICGAGAAIAYRGSLQLVNAMAPPERRAELVSTYFLAGFCGNAVPVVGVGALTARMGAATADLAFAVVVAALALAALAFGARFSRLEARTAS